MSKLVSRFGNKFTMLPNTFVMNPNVSSDAKCLMLVLQQYAWSGKDNCFPSVDTLLHYLGWSRHLYTKARKELIDKGFLEVTQEKLEGKQFGHNLYVIDPEHIYEEDTVTQINVNRDVVNHDIVNDKTTPKYTNNYKQTNNINNTNKRDATSPQNKLFNKPNNTPKQNGQLKGVPYLEIIQYLNELANKKFKPDAKESIELINKIWAEGYTLEDFKYVIENKCKEWLDPQADSCCKTWVRPSTLFKSPSKFDEYLNEEPFVKKVSSKEASYHLPNKTNDYSNLPSRRR